MTKQKWTRPKLERLDVKATLGGTLDQFPEDQDTGFTDNGETVFGGGS